MNHFKIEIRKTCKVCGIPLTGRYRTFCSTTCRQKSTNKKHRAYQLEWMRKKRAEYAEGKIQCLICGGWYEQVCSHVYYAHELTARQYKKLIGKDVKRGILTQELYSLRRDNNLDNKKIVWANLKEGEAHWYEKGDKKAGRYERSRETISRLKKKPFNPSISNI